MTLRGIIIRIYFLLLLNQNHCLIPFKSFYAMRFSTALKLLVLLLVFISCEEQDDPVPVKNNAPLVANQSFRISENSPNRTLVGTIAAYDLEGDTLKYEITGSEAQPFEVEAATGNLLVKDPSLLDAETQAKFTFTVKVTDTNDADSHTSATVTVAIEGENNPPVIGNQSFEIDENSAIGTLVGTIAASDPDGHPLKFELLDIQGVPFEVEQGTGKILVKDQNLLDYESHPTFSFLVKVTDNSPIPLNNIVVITVDVKNISEFPTAGIIARYPFNGNAKDLGPNLYDGDVVGAYPTTDRKDQENSAFLFDGMDDYIKLSTKVGTGVRSISLWFNLGINIDNRLYNPVTLLTRDGDQSNRKLFALGFIPGGWAGDPGKLRFMYSRTTEDIYYVQSNSNFWRKGVWHHVVIVLDPVKGMMMYVDNVKQQAVTPFFDATDATDASDLYPLNVYVGNYSPWSYRYFNGKIDDLVLFDKALSEDEIKALYNE